MSLEKNIKTILGNFSRASEFAEGTWHSSAEITKDRIKKKSLRDKAFCTNNHALYDVEDGDAFLYFGSKNNSIFRNETIDAAFEQLTSSETGHYYKPSEVDVAKAKQTSLKLKISELKLKFNNESYDYGYFVIDTSDLTGSKLNETQRKFAEAVYGSMEQDGKGNSLYSRAMQMLNNKGNGIKKVKIYSLYSRAMQMLNNKGNGIKKVKIYSLREETVLRDAKEGAVARACWLDDFNNLSVFDALLGPLATTALCMGYVRLAEPTRAK